jgi:hypothetical protein
VRPFDDYVLLPTIMGVVEEDEPAG